MPGRPAVRSRDMSRSLKYEIPGADWRRAPTDLCGGGHRALFEPQLGPDFDLVLEIGFGRGEFMLDLAMKHPETAFLGVEVSFKRVLKMARKVARAGIENVRLVEARGQLVVAELLPDRCLSEVWVNFSDPWPKDRHAKRRLLQDEFVAGVTRCLRPGGLFHVATDDVPYAEQIAEAFAHASGLENLNAPAPWVAEVPGRMQTGYEADWRAEGRPLHFFEYRRLGDRDE